MKDNLIESQINDFSEIDNEFNIDEDDFDISFDPEKEISLKNSRYIKPKKERSIPYNKLKYKNAKKLAKDINFESLDRVFVVVDGSFIFGDFIEAFIINHRINVTEMTLSTLSMSQDNIDSLANLADNDYIQKLNIIVSDYFYSHERGNLIKYMYEKLDKENIFQLAVCRTHCKVYCLKTEGGKHIVIHGSVNLRSSDNLEQFIIEDNKEIYDFIMDYNEKIIDRYKTIEKSIKSKELFNLIKN